MSTFIPVWPKHLQLQGKSNVKSWRIHLEFVARNIGVWDVFTGKNAPLPSPDLYNYGYESRRGVPRTFGLAEILLIKEQLFQEAKKPSNADSKICQLVSSLEDFEISIREFTTAVTLLDNSLHPSLLHQLTPFGTTKECFEYLVTRYDTTDFVARKLAEDELDDIHITRFRNLHEYLDAITHARRHFDEAGGSWEEEMVIDKIVDGLRGHPHYKDSISQSQDKSFETVEQISEKLIAYDDENNLLRPDYDMIYWCFSGADFGG